MNNKNVSITLALLLIFFLVWTIFYIDDLRINNQGISEGYPDDLQSIDDGTSDFSWRFNLRQDGYRDDISDGFDFMYFSAGKTFDFSWPGNDHVLFLIQFAIVFKDLNSNDFLVYQMRFTYSEQNYSTPITYHFQPSFDNPKGGLLNPVSEITYGIRNAEAWGWIFSNGTNLISRHNEGTIIGNYQFVTLDEDANIFEWQIFDSTNDGIFGIVKIVFRDSPWWQFRLFLQIILVITISVIWVKWRKRISY